MRIRKSVPEGYKTVPNPTSTTPQSLPHSPLPLYQKAQELSPFCGLHKIGNLSSRSPTAPIPTPGERDVGLDLPQLLFNDEDGYDFSPASTQESTPGKGRDSALQDTPTRLAWPSKKRIWDEEEEEEEEEDDVGLLALMEQEHEMASSTIPSPSYPTHHLRTLAQPKTRRKLFCPETSGPKLQLAGTGEDFDEAAFFQADDWRDVGMEM